MVLGDGDTVNSWIFYHCLSWCVLSRSQVDCSWPLSVFSCITTEISKFVLYWSIIFPSFLANELWLALKSRPWFWVACWLRMSRDLTYIKGLQRNAWIQKSRFDKPIDLALSHFDMLFSIISPSYACFSHSKWLIIVYIHETSLRPICSSYYSVGSHIYGVPEPYRVNLHRFVLLLKEAGIDVSLCVSHPQPPLPSSVGFALCNPKSRFDMLMGIT